MNWTFWTRTQPTDPDDCTAIDPLLSLYADHMASAEEARRVEAHLPDCAACRESLAWMRATQFALASRPVALPPADLRARIAAAIAASSDAPVPASFSTRRAFAVRPAYAAAASVALLGFIGYGLLYHPQPAAVHPAPPPLVATVPSVNTSAPVIKTAPGVKMHLTPHSAPAARHARPDPSLIARNKADEITPAPVVVKTHIQAKPENKMVANVVPVMATEKAPLATTRKPAPRKFHPEMLATNKNLAPAAETHKPPVVKPEPKTTDTVVAEAPHTQPPAFVEKQPVIAPDPAPTVAVASNGEGRFQTAEANGMIRLHAAIPIFMHATFKIDKNVAMATGLGSDRSRTQPLVGSDLH